MQRFDITTFTETKLDKQVTLSSISANGFMLNRLDRNSRGGGVITYIKDHLHPKTLESIQAHFNALHLEVTVTEILIQSKTKAVILGIYRPPSSTINWFNNFNDLILEVSALGSLIIMGDLNCDLLKPNIQPGKTLLSSLELASVEVNNIAPTRYGKNSATCLDIIAVSLSLKCEPSKVGDLAASDHLPVETAILTGKCGKLQPVIKRSLNKIDYDKLNIEMSNIKLTAQVVEMSDPDAMLDHWHKSFMNILDTVAPVKSYPMRKNRCVWLNHHVRTLIEDRDRTARQLKSDPFNIELKKQLQTLKKKAKSNLRRAARQYGEDLLQERKTRHAWSFIREVTHTTGKKERASIDPNALNDFFADQVTSISKEPLREIQICDNSNNFEFSPLPSGSVFRLLSTVKTNTAAGHDAIPGLLLKKLAPSISSNITCIINTSFKHGIVPDAWKRANVSGIWKGKGAKSEPTNYRPISVLPILARITERACAKQLSHFVEENNLIPSQQFGFRAHSSCEHAIIKGLDSWMGSIDKGEVVGSLLVDMSKAFDTVPHQLLLTELAEIGCSQNILQWFFSYLTNREQRVLQGPHVTSWKPVSRGVPQGSSLSPLLFNIFVRKLPDVSTTPTIQFADDVTHSESDKSPEVVVKKLSEAFTLTKKFCNDRDLQINTEKTQFIIFKAANKKLPEGFHITLDGFDIEPADTVKLLGVTLDKHLTFKDHIDGTVKKCHGLLGVLSRSAPFLSTELLRLAYCSLIRSQLEYCSSAFASAADTHLKKLQIIQKMAARIICRKPRNTHSAPLLDQLRLDSLQDRREEHIIALVKQLLGDTCPPALSGMFTKTELGNVSNSSTRDPKHRIGKKRFSVHAELLYNSKL